MSSQPVLVTEICDLTLISIAAGSYHSAAVDDQGRLWTWGWGVHGQLGLGSIEDEFVPRRVLHREMSREVVVKVDAGYAHTIALTGYFQSPLVTRPVRSCVSLTCRSSELLSNLMFLAHFVACFTPTPEKNE